MPGIEPGVESGNGPLIPSKPLLLLSVLRVRPNHRFVSIKRKNPPELLGQAALQTGWKLAAWMPDWVVFSLTDLSAVKAGASCPPESLAVNLSHRKSPELGDYAAYEVIRIRWNPLNSELSAKGAADSVVRESVAKWAAQRPCSQYLRPQLPNGHPTLAVPQ